MRAVRPPLPRTPGARLSLRRLETQTPILPAHCSAAASPALAPCPSGLTSPFLDHAHPEKHEPPRSAAEFRGKNPDAAFGAAANALPLVRWGPAASDWAALGLRVPPTRPVAEEDWLWRASHCAPPLSGFHFVYGTIWRETSDGKGSRGRERSCAKMAAGRARGLCWTPFLKSYEKVPISKPRGNRGAGRTRGSEMVGFGCPVCTGRRP
jgi:hypothetical protein